MTAYITMYGIICSGEKIVTTLLKNDADFSNAFFSQIKWYWQQQDIWYKNRGSPSDEGMVLLHRCITSPSIWKSTVLSTFKIAGNKISAFNLLSCYVLTTQMVQQTVLVTQYSFKNSFHNVLPKDVMQQIFVNV